MQSKPDLCLELKPGTTTTEQLYSHGFVKIMLENIQRVVQNITINVKQTKVDLTNS